MAGTLHLVATPIGNLGDVTARAVEVLRTVAFVVCEDTRHSGPWLRSLGVQAPLLSLPAFAEKERVGGIVARLEAGEDGALVTDAGSPGISDPGEALVAEAVARGLRVVPVPGPSAVIAALSASGLPSGRFHFLGFLPRSGPGPDGGARGGGGAPGDAGPLRVGAAARGDAGRSRGGARCRAGRSSPGS